MPGTIAAHGSKVTGLTRFDANNGTKLYLNADRDELYIELSDRVFKLDADKITTEP